MSQLAELTGASDSSSLKGFTISPWTLAEYGDAESEFEKAHVRTAGLAAADLPTALGDRVISAALRDVRSGELKYGSAGFDLQLLTASNLPFILWLSLRAKHPKMTREDAAALVTKETMPEIQRAVLEPIGFTNKKKDQTKDLESQSSGEQSSPHSEREDSGTPK